MITEKIKTIAGISVLVILLLVWVGIIIDSITIEYGKKVYRRSLLGKQAIINESHLPVTIMDYDPYKKIAKCRFDQGPNVSPRFQEVEFMIAELTVQSK